MVQTHHWFRWVISQHLRIFARCIPGWPSPMASQRIIGSCWGSTPSTAKSLLRWTARSTCGWSWVIFLLWMLYSKNKVPKTSTFQSSWPKFDLWHALERKLDNWKRIYFFANEAYPLEWFYKRHRFFMTTSFVQLCTGWCFIIIYFFYFPTFLGWVIFVNRQNTPPTSTNQCALSSACDLLRIPTKRLSWSKLAALKWRYERYSRTPSKVHKTSWYFYSSQYI